MRPQTYYYINKNKVIIWRVHPEDAPPTLLLCYLHAWPRGKPFSTFSLTMMSLARVETCIPLTEHLAVRIFEIQCLPPCAPELPLTLLAVQPRSSATSLSPLVCMALSSTLSILLSPSLHPLPLHAARAHLNAGVMLMHLCNCYFSLSAI